MRRHAINPWKACPAEGLRAMKSHVIKRILLLV